MALNLKTETVFTDDTPAAQPPLPPEQIAPHFPQLEILECLGRGGMGVVYKARQKSLNRLVALKLLAPERVQDAKFAERFAREAQALAALNHPNIVTIHDFGQAGGFYYLLMEFVDGVNLRQLLRARKFTPEEALAIVPPLCDALQFAHDRGIIHRDIKPENLLLDKTGRVKVADFGIAKMLGEERGCPSRSGNDDKDAAEKSEPSPFSGSAAAGTAALPTALTGGQTVGTPSYSAPEQKTDPQRVDSRADIYSLGVVFYEMLTGELPGKKIAPPSTKVQIDVRLDEIVLRALEQKPELRYQQVSEVKTMVETIVSDPKKPEFRSQKPEGGPAHFFPPETPLPTAGSGYSFSDARRWWIVLAIPGIFLVCYILRGGRLADYLGSDSFGLSLALMGTFALLTLLPHVRKERGRIVFVGVSSGKREINWSGVVQMWVVIYAAFLAGSYLGFGYWVPLHDLIAGMVGAATLVTAALVQVELKKPIEQLPPGSSRREETQTEKSEIGNRKSEIVPRFSRTAIVGACLTVLPFGISIISLALNGTDPHERAVMILTGTCQLLALMFAAITTTLGWMAVLQIRRSAGKLYGLWLAVFDGLLFPLLALNLLIGDFTFAILLAIGKVIAPEVNGSPGTGLVILLSLLIAIPFNWFVIRAVWRAVNKGGAGVPPAEPVRKNPTIKIIAIVCGVLVLGAGIAVVSVHQSSNRALRAASLTSADFHYRVFVADAALVDQLIPAAQRKNGVSPTAKFLTQGLENGGNSRSIGSFSVSTRGFAFTDSQVAEIAPATLKALLDGIGNKPGMLADQTQNVSGVWWPYGMGSIWGYNRQDGVTMNGSGAVNLGFHQQPGKDEIRIEGAVHHDEKLTKPDGSPDLHAKFLYEGNAPQNGALVFLVPFFRQDNSEHYLVVVYEVGNNANTSALPAAAAQNPSFGPASAPAAAPGRLVLLAVPVLGLFLILAVVVTVLLLVLKKSKLGAGKAIAIGCGVLMAILALVVFANITQHLSRGSVDADECIIERAQLPDDIPGLQVFRWNYSIPQNHVAIFRFIVATNGPPQWIDGLTEWIAAGTNQPAKGFMQWSLQDGRTLSPELDQQERWDMMLRLANGGGTSYSLWMNKVWRDGGLALGDQFRIKPGTTEDIWVQFKSVKGKSQFASQSEMYGSNYVLMQVSLEALPPGLSAGANGFGCNGTNWLDLLTRVFKNKLPKLTNSPTSPQPASPATIQNLSFGPVVERVLPDQQGGQGPFINFESGELVSAPNSLVENRNDRTVLIDWLVKAGADASAIAGENGGHRLVSYTQDTCFSEVSPSSWERMNESGLLLAWQSAARTNKIFLGNPDLLPRTFVFETRTGIHGLLQITGFTENPHGVKIRYKLVQSTGPQTDASALQFRLVLPEDSTAASDQFPDVSGHGQLRVSREALLDGSAVAQAGLDFNPDGTRKIEIQFTAAGRQRFAQITATNIRHQLAVVFRSKVLCAPFICSALTDGQCQIDGNMSREEVYALLDCLNRTTTASDQTWKFTAPRERSLPFQRSPEILFGWLDLDSGTILTNSMLDWQSRAGHEWIRTNGLDVVATESSKNIPILLDVDLVLAPAPTNGWDIITAADVGQDWTLMQQEPRQEQIFGAPPGQSGTFLFQTREGGKGILQITGFSENPPGVKLRYKLAQNVGGKN
jgi:serine/threonine protein kinase